MSTTIAASPNVGDVGTSIQLIVTENGVPVNVSTATLLQITFSKPDASIVVKTASFVTDGTDGNIKYVTVAGDLDQSGTWSLQADVTMPGGVWSSDIQKMKVGKKLGVSS